MGYLELQAFLDLEACLRAGTFPDPPLVASLIKGTTSSASWALAFGVGSLVRASGNLRFVCIRLCRRVELCLRCQRRDVGEMRHLWVLLQELFP